MAQTLVPCQCGRGLRDQRAVRCRQCWSERNTSAANARVCGACGERRVVLVDSGGKTRYRCRTCEARKQRERHRPKPRKGKAVRLPCTAPEGCDNLSVYVTRQLCRKHYERLNRTGTTDTRTPAPANPILRQRANLRAAARSIGLDADMIVRHFEAHHGLCDICGGPPTRARLDIDHDHTTGAFRGLLCGNCNRALGLLRDDPIRLRLAADYLERR